VNRRRALAKVGPRCRRLPLVAAGG